MEPHNPVFIGGAALVAVAAALWLSRSPSLDPAKAQSLMNGVLSGSIARTGMLEPVRALSAEGTTEKIPMKQLKNAVVVGCDKTGGRGSSLAGRHGGGNRTYGIAGFECLFRVTGPEGRDYYISAYLTRSKDPSVQSHQGGYSITLRRDTTTRRLMHLLQ